MSAEARPKAAVVNLGCRVNRVELDDIAAGLVSAGMSLADEREAELVVINTCAVTGEAEKKARKAIRHAASLPARPLVVATGCAAALFSSELASLGENVSVVADKSAVVARCCEEMGIDPPRRGPCPSGPVGITGRVRPGIKVQDGCDSRCAYCIVWKARGPSRSLGLDEVVARVRDASAQGAGEVVLTGINLGRYDVPLGGGRAGLARLVDAVLERTDVGRVRLSSVEPLDVTPELLGVMSASDGRVAPFLHLPLQSGCDATLARMGRPYDSGGYRSVAEAAREALPALALACDVMVGFPGEDEGEFSSSHGFCREMAFARMHVFRYSPRPGTVAAAASGQVAPAEKAARGERMRSLSREMRASYLSGLVGRTERVCVESPGRATTGGLAEALVDERLPVGGLSDVLVRAVGRDGLLDARPPLSASGDITAGDGAGHHNR